MIEPEHAHSLFVIVFAEFINCIINHAYYIVCRDGHIRMISYSTFNPE